MMDETTERREHEAQLQAAMAAMRATVLRLLQQGEVHPQLVVLAAAATAGELAASVALADGRDIEELVGELAEFVRQTGRAHHEMLQAEVLPVAGNA